MKNNSRDQGQSDNGEAAEIRCYGLITASILHSLQCSGEDGRKG